MTLQAYCVHKNYAYAVMPSRGNEMILVEIYFIKLCESFDVSRAADIKIRDYSR